MTKKKTPGSGGKKPPTKPKTPAERAAETRGKVTTRLLSRNTEKLICDLTEAEIAQRRAEVSRKVGVLAEHNTFMKKESARLSAQKKELEASITSLSASAEAGRTEREVAVEDHADYVESVVKTIRTDTNQIVRERPLRPDERQDPLPLKGLATPSGGKIVSIKGGKVDAPKKGVASDLGPENPEAEMDQAKADAQQEEADKKGGDDGEDEGTSKKDQDGDNEPMF